ncbi:MAG: peptidylprolyl isomerase [Lachnospiraceae bacterium]
MKKRWASVIGVSMLAAAVLSGCGGWKVNTSIGDTYLMTIGEGELLRSEAMLVVMDYKGQYEKYNTNLGGEDFWSETDKDGRTYGDIVKNDFIWEELTALTALNGMAVRDGVSLTQEEEAKAEEAGRAYFETLNEAEKDYTGASEDTAVSLMKKYKTAEKEIAYCTDGEEMEVSDEETRVMDIQVIYVTDEAQANQAYERVSNGEDFETVASELSQDPQINYTVSRGELNTAVENAVFQLESGELSPIIKAEQDFYIIKCLNDFDVSLSSENRNRILESKVYKAWEEDWNEYMSGNTVHVNEWSWNHIRLEYVEGVENDRFYSIYEEYMQE